MAEFFGVMILIIFGAGVDCQVVLSTNTDVASSQKGVRCLSRRCPRRVSDPHHRTAELLVHQLWLGCRYVTSPVPARAPIGPD